MRPETRDIGNELLQEARERGFPFVPRSFILQSWVQVPDNHSPRPNTPTHTPLSVFLKLTSNLSADTK